MKSWHLGLVVLMILVLVGCGGEEAAPALEDEGVGDAYTSDTLDTAYDGALSASN